MHRNIVPWLSTLWIFTWFVFFSPRDCVLFCVYQIVVNVLSYYIIFHQTKRWMRPILWSLSTTTTFWAYLWLLIQQNHSKSVNNDFGDVLITFLSIFMAVIMICMSIIVEFEVERGSQRFLKSSTCWLFQNWRKEEHKPIWHLHNLTFICLPFTVGTLEAQFNILFGIGNLFSCE